VVATVDAAMDDMRDLPPRPPAFGVGWRATDQEDIAGAGVVAKVSEQAGDRRRNAPQDLGNIKIGCTAVNPCNKAVFSGAGRLVADAIVLPFPLPSLNITELEPIGGQFVGKTVARDGSIKQYSSGRPSGPGDLADRVAYRSSDKIRHLPQAAGLLSF
jgi:hypothetical protein